MKTYPQIVTNSIDNHSEILRQITRLRNEDIGDFDNLQNQYIGGRKTNRIPSGSADVLATDRVGDLTYDLSFGYFLIDVGGTVAWRRWALSAW